MTGAFQSFAKQVGFRYWFSNIITVRLWLQHAGLFESCLFFWLRSSEHIQYELVMTEFWSLGCLAPKKLSDDLRCLVEIPSRRRLLSLSSLQLDVPRTHRRTVGDWAFAAAGPTLWNSLPLGITDCVSLTFCRKLKTFCLLYHFHDYIFLFSGPWGLYLGHFEHFLCIYVCRPSCCKL